MKVVFIGPLPEPMTGQSLACQVFFDELAKNHTVDLINLSKGSLAQGLSSFGRVLAVLKIIWGVWRKCHDADVFYLTVSESRAGNAKDLLIFLACARHLRRMAIHLHGGAGMRRIMSANMPISRVINCFFLKRLGAVIVLGDALKDIYGGLVEPERLIVVPNFAEDMVFGDHEQIYAKFECQRPLRLLFLSNLLPGKGHLELVSAYEGLKLEQQRALTIDFAGSFENDIQRDAFLARIHGKRGLTYHGPVRGDAKLALFKRAHVFCLPTYYPYEGQPISILEAYAAGCAVITTAHSGIPDIFSDQVNGLLVEMGSPESIRAAIEHALTNPELLRTCALHNRKDAQIKYRADRYSASLEATLKTLYYGVNTQSELQESTIVLRDTRDSPHAGDGQQDIQHTAGRVCRVRDRLSQYGTRSDDT